MKAEKQNLQKLLGSGSLIFDEPSSLRTYSFDQGEVPEGLKKLLLPDTMPDLAVQPGSSEDLQSCIRYGLNHDIPLVPRGASTFGMGGAVPHQGGILLDFSALREIYDFDPAAGLVRVSAGCRWPDVAQFLQPLGFDLCTYPTSWFSTVGGWASTGGVGIGCTRYGSFHDLVSAMTVVTASGEIQKLTANDPELRYFLGTEGQMGAIWDITFHVRKKPVMQRPFVLLFENPSDALEGAGELLAKFKPYHLKYLSEPRVHEINHLMREEHPSLRKEMILPEKDSLLVCFEDAAEADEFRRWTLEKGWVPVSDYKAHLLWRERMFPLRVKRMAPGLLASELILPLEKVARYTATAAALGRKFHVDLATECYFLNDRTALTLPVYTFRANGIVDEALKSSLAFALTQAGIDIGGRPYGIGIWNSAFLKRKFGAGLRDLSYYKNSNDPRRLFNRGKFFDVDFRCGIAGKLAALPLRSALIPLWTPLAALSAPFLTRDVAGRRPEDLILENEELCSKCGSCIPVCPAYIDTRDERTTARGKLQLGKWILQGGELSAGEANTLFLCMHCGACTDVCQSRLDLVPVWDELERRVEARYGKDEPRIAGFVNSVEEKKIMGVPYARGAQVRAGNQSK